MSDIKKIKDEFINKLKEDLDLNSVNQIKTDLFGKNGKISNEFKKLGSVATEDRKSIMHISSWMIVRRIKSCKIIIFIFNIRTFLTVSYTHLTLPTKA